MHLDEHVLYARTDAVPRLDPLLLAALGHVQHDEDDVRAQDFSAEVSTSPDLRWFNRGCVREQAKNPLRSSGDLRCIQCP